jgi:hypothetical protein
MIRRCHTSQEMIGTLLVSNQNPCSTYLVEKPVLDTKILLSQEPMSTQTIF